MLSGRLHITGNDAGGVTTVHVPAYDIGQTQGWFTARAPNTFERSGHLEFNFFTEA